jgi:2TM domain
MADPREEARRHVRRKRTFYTVLLVYLALVVLWFLIDVLTGDDWWFYWPMLGAGIIVAIIEISMFGIRGLFGADWEGRQMDKYLQGRSESPDEGTGPGRS